MMFDTRETATVLAALRHFQRNAALVERQSAYPEHFADVDPLNDKEIDVLCERINGQITVHHDYAAFELPDQSSERKPAIHGSLKVEPQLVAIRFVGYGEHGAIDGEGTPVIVENYEGSPRVIIWGDINEPDPTHIIHLCDAAESLRKPE